MKSREHRKTAYRLHADQVQYQFIHAWLIDRGFHLVIVKIDLNLSLALRTAGAILHSRTLLKTHTHTVDVLEGHPAVAYDLAVDRAGVVVSQKPPIRPLIAFEQVLVDEMRRHVHRVLRECIDRSIVHALIETIPSGVALLIHAAVVLAGLRTPG